MQLNLLVLRSRRPETLVSFYEGLGLVFVRERHGFGPVHHAATSNGSVFEIYPLLDGEGETTATRIGFLVTDLDRICEIAKVSHGTVLRAPAVSASGRRAVLVDPEGHKVELSERTA